MSVKTMRVMPVEGRVTIDPQTGDAIPAAGQLVPRNAYWCRRIAAGDVTEVVESAVAKSTKQRGDK